MFVLQVETNRQGHQGQQPFSFIRRRVSGWYTRKYPRIIKYVNLYFSNSFKTAGVCFRGSCRGRENRSNVRRDGFRVHVRSKLFQKLRLVR